MSKPVSRRTAVTPEEMRREALNTALETIEKKYGQGSIMRLSLTAMAPTLRRRQVERSATRQVMSMKYCDQGARGQSQAWDGSIIFDPYVELILPFNYSAVKWQLEHINFEKS